MHEYGVVDRVPELVQTLYKIVQELEACYPGRHFTPDGHLVGSLGEVLAANRYRLRLNAASTNEYSGEVDQGFWSNVTGVSGGSAL